MQPFFSSVITAHRKSGRFLKFHLVVHDIGGPIGFALAALVKWRILSVTILNTWLDVEQFEKPLPMRPFSLPILGEIELATNHARNMVPSRPWAYQI